MPTFSHREPTRRAALTEADLGESGQCGRPHNQLGFAYQPCFVRLLNRFPIQEPFEVVDDLVLFVALQLGKEPELLSFLGGECSAGVLLHVDTCLLHPVCQGAGRQVQVAGELRDALARGPGQFDGLGLLLRAEPPSLLSSHLFFLLWFLFGGV